MSVSKDYKPMRMCICCRVRQPQDKMLRFQKNATDICVFSGFGRSFYICIDCKHSPILIKKLASYLKIPQHSVEHFATQNKETIFGQSSN